MKKLILILALLLSISKVFTQHILTPTGSIDLSTWSGSDSVIYKEFTGDFNKGFAVDFELIDVVRECLDSITIDIGGTPTENGFDQYNSEKFPYTIAVADTITGSLLVGDFCTVTPKRFLAVKISTTGDCWAGILVYYITK